MAKSFLVNGQEFRTQKDLVKHVQAIMARYQDGEVLDLFDYPFMLDLLNRHPYRDSKVGGGVAAIYVAPNPTYPGKNSRCFYLIRVDGSRTDFSYRECITPTPHSKKVLSALRVAVEPDTRAFKDRAFGVEKFLRCPVTDEVLTFTSAHVDHRAPRTFANLVEMFLRSEGITLAEIAVNELSLEEMSCQDQIADPQLCARWVMFHNDHADLEIVSHRANLSVRRTNA